MTAEQIRQYRESKGLTQSQFASLLRVSPTAVTQWEKGQVPSGPASLLLEHLILGTPLFSSGGDADWDMPLTLKEWEELERRRARTGFLSVRDYMVWLVRQEMQKSPPVSVLPSVSAAGRRGKRGDQSPSDEG